VGCDTLANGTLGATVYEDRQIGVGMDVNEPWRDESIIDVQDFPAPQRASRRDLSNPACPDGKIAPEPGIPASIQNPAIG
jgi:hypothetical protein